MANTLTAIVPKIWASGVKALRQNATMPYLVNRDYDPLVFANKGDTINVTLPYAVSPYNVTPANVPPVGSDITPTTVQITMANWKGTSFHLTDKEMQEINKGFIPDQLTENIKALVNEIDVFCFNGIYPFVKTIGTPGTTPFTAVSGVKDVRVALSKQLCPLEDRRMVCDPDAYGNASILEQFASGAYVNDSDAMMEGKLNRRLGFSWHEDQNVQTHTKGTGASYVLTDIEPLGETEILLKTGSGTVLVGDVVTFAGHATIYRVVVGVAVPGTITIEPGLTVEVAADVAMTVGENSVGNLAFNKGAYVLINRPLYSDPGGNFFGAFDPISGLHLRLEQRYEYKRTVWEFDVCYGGKLIRPEKALRVLG